MTAGRPTSQDVADLAGVSRSAVSLVLNGRAEGMISTAKQEVIRHAARQLNYVPNAVALSLRTSRTRTIGVLADQLGTAPAFGATLSGAGTRAVQDGFLLMIVGRAATDGDEERALEILRTRQVDALLFVCAGLVHRPSPDLLRRYPAALANCLDTDAVVPSLISDEAGAVRLLAEHLISHGHRDLALVTAADGPASQAHRQGYEAALRAAALPGRAPVAVSPDIAGGHSAGAQLLSGGTPPTAVIAADERAAVGLALAAAMYGFSIPADLSLVAVEEEPGLMSTMKPAVTAVRQPYAQIGRRAVQLVLDRLERITPEEPGRAVQALVVGDLVVGESVAPPRPG